MDNPCRICITYPICQNRRVKFKWDECWMYRQFMSEDGWFEHQGQIISCKSHARTTTIKIAPRRVKHPYKSEATTTFVEVNYG